MAPDDAVQIVCNFDCLQRILGDCVEYLASRLGTVHIQWAVICALGLVFMAPRIRSALHRR